MSEGPSSKTKLIVLMAFDRDGEGELRPAFEPREMPDKARAKRKALDLKGRHAGVVAWVRDANPALGEFGPPGAGGLWRRAGDGVAYLAAVPSETL